MYELFCTVASTPCPAENQVAVANAVFSISAEDVALAFALGFSVVFTPIFLAWAAGTLLAMID